MKRNLRNSYSFKAAEGLNIPVSKLKNFFWIAIWFGSEFNPSYYLTFEKLLPYINRIISDQ